MSLHHLACTQILKRPRKRGRPSFHAYDLLTRPLCSNPVTGPSALLRVDPPQLAASVLSPHSFRPLVLLPWHQQAGSRSST
jgi:hypothetical protein